MERVFSFIAGYVLIAVEGEQAERFLNLCRAKGIVIRKITYEGMGKFHAVISVRNFFRLGSVHKKTKVHIHIMEKHGLPFFFLQCQKRKAFFLGIFLCAGIIFVLSGRIWNIHIEGNRKNSTPEILNFLSSQGIRHGIAKKEINCSQIAALVRQNYPEITWVSAKMEGTRLILTIQEGILAQENETSEEPCNIVADVEGTIIEMITRNGIPQTGIGETCKIGDTLVLGRLDYKNDSQEVYQYEYVHADADIYVQHEISYYDEFPLEYKAQVPTEQEEKGCYIKLGSFYMQFGDNKMENTNSLTEEYPLRITENFFLPVSFGRITTWRYKIQKREYTEKEAKNLAIEKLHIYEENLIEKGVQISANNVKIEVDHKSCISRGTLLVIEKTGKDVPVQIQPTPQTEKSETEGQ